MSDQISSSGQPLRVARRRRARTVPSNHSTARRRYSRVFTEFRGQSPHAPGGRAPAQSAGGHHHANTSFVPPPADPSSDDAIRSICLRLADHQKVRRFCIVSQSRCDRSMQAAIASCIGLDVSESKSTEVERKALFKRAAAIMTAVEKGKPYDPLPPGDPRQERLAGFIPLIKLSAMSRAVWDAKREETEKEMRALAKQLPVFAWVRDHAKGIGDLGLARLVGEAPLICDTGIYSTHEKLWKRFGVAVLAGERQQRKTDKTEALLHGFAPARRAELWSVCSDSLLRAQWRGDRVDEATGEVTDGRPVGPYGDVYRARKMHTLPRIEATEALDFKDRAKWTKKRCDSDARRDVERVPARSLAHLAWASSAASGTLGDAAAECRMSEFRGQTSGERHTRAAPSGRPFGVCRSYLCRYTVRGHFMCKPPSHARPECDGGPKAYRKPFRQRPSSHLSMLSNVLSQRTQAKRNSTLHARGRCRSCARTSRSTSIDLWREPR